MALSFFLNNIHRNGQYSTFLKLISFRQKPSNGAPIFSSSHLVATHLQISLNNKKEILSMYLLWLTSNNFVFQLRLTIFVMFETMCFKKSVRSVCPICLPDKWGWEVHWWSSYLHITYHQYKNTTHTSVYQLTIVARVGAFYFVALTTTMHENQKMTISVYFWRLLPTPTEQGLNLEVEIKCLK